MKAEISTQGAGILRKSLNIVWLMIKLWALRTQTGRQELLSSNPAFDTDSSCGLDKSLDTPKPIYEGAEHP